MASFTGVAPPDNTCIAMALTCLVFKVCSYKAFPPLILKPSTLMDEQMIGFFMPTLSSMSNSLGIFIVI